MDKQQAQTIAQWWCNRMDDQNKHDNGNPEDAISFTSGTEKLKALGFKFKDVPTDEQKDNFKMFLSTLLLMRGGDLEYIEVDYDPDEILEDALMMAGITFNPFPIKTILWPESMECRIGYSGERHSVEVAE
jgi:hypothetical protein